MQLSPPPKRLQIKPGQNVPQNPSATFHFGSNPEQLLSNITVAPMG